jgi:hypothetical protein
MHENEDKDTSTDEVKKQSTREYKKKSSGRARMFVFCVSRIGTRLCDKPIPHPEEPLPTLLFRCV